jgi:methanogenic corrinoid protein MtbC1
LTYVTEELAPTVASRTTLFIYIAAASRQLGARWEADEVSFTEVTLAVGKLYALVRSIGSSVRRAPIARALQKSALFASVPGEQHTLGVTIAAEVFRDAGWDVDLQLDRSHEELLARVDATMPAVVGLSLSGPARLDALVRLVVAVRLAKPDALIAVASGGDGKPETLRTVVDLDLVITDVRQAQLELSRLLQRRLAP